MVSSRKATPARFGVPAMRAAAVFFSAVCLANAASAQDCNSNGVPDNTELDYFGVVLDSDPVHSIDVDPSDQFGRASSVSGGVAIIGAPMADAEAGAGYLYEREDGQWVERVKLSPGATGDRAGFSVGASGDLVVLGLPLADADGAPDAGEVAVYRRTGNSWLLETRLKAPVQQEGAQFGFAVSVSGNRVLVGEPLRDIDTMVNVGRAYVFVSNGAGNWGLEQQLNGSDSAAQNQFGLSVSLSNFTAVVGTPLDDQRGLNAGAVYLFSRSASTWTQNQKLAPMEIAAGDRFGITTAIDGNRLAVGADRHDFAGADAGAAFIFDYNGSTWAMTQRVIANDAAVGDNFGISVGLAGDLLVSGAPTRDESVTDSGAAYFFQLRNGTWTQFGKKTNPAAVANDQMGRSVATDGVDVVAGAALDDLAASDGGAFYACRLFRRDCDDNNMIDSCEIAANPGLDTNGDGVLDACEPPPPPPPVPNCDWNNDESVDSQDFFDFLDDFFDIDADYNMDGLTTSQDLFDFINDFLGGNCV